MSLRPVPVLLYHRIEPEGGGVPTAISTPLEVFRAHLEWLADHGYRSLTLAELEARIDGAPPTAEREVVITFDDGYDCLVERAAPAMRDTGMKGASFLITEAVGGEGHLTWDQARALADEGVFEFHSHSHTHPRWQTAPDTAAEVGRELAVTRKILADQLGADQSDVHYMAWPYGRADEEWEQAAIEEGFTTQFIVQRGAVTRSGLHHRLPRLMVDGMPLSRLTQWMNVLQSRPGAAVSNRAFGTIRQLRHNVGYV